MERSSLFDEYRQILIQLTDDITQYYGAHEAYLSSFPKEVQNGLFSTQIDMAHVFREYCVYIHKITNTLKLADNTANRLTDLMLSSDRAMESELVLQCNAVMDKYMSYRTSLTEYLSKNEKEINAKKQNTSLPFMFNTASEFKYKTELLVKWLKDKLASGF